MLSVINNTLSGVDIFFLIVNLFGILYAFYWNFRCFKEGSFKKNPLAILVLLVISFVGYSVLMFTNVSILAWSSFFRGVSPLAWFYVWAGPAKSWVDSHFVVKKQTDHLEEKIYQIIEEIVGRQHGEKKDDE